MPLVLRRRGRQGKQSDEIPDQVSIGRQNPVPEELDPAVGSTGGSAAKDRVEQLAAEIGEIRHEMRTLIELLAERRQPRQDQALPPVPRPQAPLEKQQPTQQGQYLSVALYEFWQNKPLVFSGIEHDADLQDFVDVCDCLCTTLGCSLIRAVELTSYQLTRVAYEWYKSLLRSWPMGSPTLDWPEFYNAFVEWFMLESIRDANARQFELLKQTEAMSVLDYDTRFNQLAKYAPHIVMIDNMKAKRFANGIREYLFRAVPLTRTSTYSDVLDTALRFEA